MIIGIILNILMVVGQAWPTFLYGIFFLVGLIFYIISKNFNSIKIYQQIIIIVFPFLIFYVYEDANSPSKDLFLIPEGFRGKVVILYNQKDGQEKEFEGKYRVYKIPSTGILKTKFEVKGDSWNIGDAKYYYINGTEKISIKQYCLYCEKEKIDTISIQAIPGEGGSFSSNENSIHYLSFYIDIPNKFFKPTNNIDQTLIIK